MTTLRAINFLAVLSSLTLVVAALAGGVSSANAFFFAVAIVTLYLGYQLSLRDGEPLKDTLLGLIARPSLHPRRAAYVAYVSTLAISGFVVLESLSGGL